MRNKSVVTGLLPVVIVVLLGVYFMRPAWLGLETREGMFRGDGSNHVVLFTSNGCGGGCVAALDFLNASEQVFDELPISVDKDNYALYKKLGGKTTPYLVSGYTRVSGFNRQDYLSVLADARGLAVLDVNLRRAYEQHFDKQQQSLLVMYGASDCMECAAVREYCGSHGIKLIEWDVDADLAAKQRYQLLEGQAYPLLYYGARRLNVYSAEGLQDLLD